MSDFSVFRIKFTAMVNFRVSRKIHDTLPDTYGLRAEDLVQVMNSWQSAALARQPPPSSVPPVAGHGADPRSEQYDAGE